MNGATFEEIEEYLLHGHEVVFVYKGHSYTMEPDKENGKRKIYIWGCLENEIIEKVVEDFVENIKGFDKFFNIKCFDGKSFYEIEKEVTVEYIF